MVKELLTIPIVLAIVVGFGTQLETTANDVSAKTLAFTDDMNLAIPCATHGIPISECSPELLNYDFSEEREEFTTILEDMKEQLGNLTIEDFEEYNQTNSSN